jgi:hypothetical protein
MTVQVTGRWVASGGMRVQEMVTTASQSELEQVRASQSKSEQCIVQI